MSPADVQPEVIAQVRRLHASVDGSAKRLEVLHEPRLQCRRGCSDCCADDLTVSVAEAARILHENAELLASATPGEAGGCAMLDADGACRIYASRPYVCRTQGLPLRWLETDASVGNAPRVEHRPQPLPLHRRTRHPGRIVRQHGVSLLFAPLPSHVRPDRIHRGVARRRIKPSRQHGVPRQPRRIARQSGKDHLRHIRRPVRIAAQPAQRRGVNEIEAPAHRFGKSRLGFFRGATAGETRLLVLCFLSLTAPAPQPHEILSHPPPFPPHWRPPPHRPPH